MSAKKGYNLALFLFIMHTCLVSPDKDIPEETKFQFRTNTNGLEAPRERIRGRLDEPM